MLVQATKGGVIGVVLDQAMDSEAIPVDARSLRGELRGPAQRT